MRGVSTPRIYSDGKRLALAAAASGVQFVGDRALFALGDGAVLNAGIDGAGARIEAHDGAILCAALAPGGKSIITGGDDGALRSVTPSGEISVLIDGGRKWIEHVVTSAASGLIVAAAGKEAIVIRNGAIAHRFSYPTTLGGLALDAKGRKLAASHYNGVTLRLALVADDKGTALTWAGSHLALTLAPDGDYVITAMQENALHGWRIADKLDLQMTGYPAKTRSFSWNRNGRWLATSGADQAVIWPFTGKAGPQGKPPLTLAQRDAVTVTAVAFHPSEDILALGYSDGATLLIQLADGVRIDLDEPGEGPVSALAWSGDGTLIAWGDEAGRGGIVTAP